MLIKTFVGRLKATRNNTQKSIVNQLIIHFRNLQQKKTICNLWGAKSINNLIKYSI